MQGFTFYLAKALRVLLQPPALRSSNKHVTSRICSGSQINYTSIARYSYIGHDCFLNNVAIGSFCSIADNCHIGGAAHIVDYVSTSPVFVSGRNVLRKNFSKHANLSSKTTIIENDVWIGQGVSIKQGVTIHTGAVIGFGSVVTKDIPPYAIVAGNPARVIRYRFNESTVDYLLTIKWWNRSDKELEIISRSFSSPDELRSCLENNSER